ncbi:MAG: S41 family peptidase [Thermoanaerobaculia bacterium]
MHRRTAALLAFSLALVHPAFAAADTKLLRFPDVHGDRVVFTYGGDLWTAPTAGGTATRLTAHPGLEVFGKFSPDGQWIAFTGQYDGDEQVYVMPAQGGEPRQLTFDPARGPLTPRWGYDHQVYGWTPDGKAVLFRSLMDGWDLGQSRLYTVPLEGGLPEALPMALSGAGDLSPDRQRAVFSPLFRDFRTWKRYSGGWAQDLWIMDLASHDAENITHHPRTDRDPMWIGDSIWFASDRDGKLNLYSYDPASKKTAQATHSTEWDVRWPSKGDAGEIVYELGGGLHVFDTRSGTDRAISISVPTDGLDARPKHVAVGDRIEDFGLSPKGERALFTARGDVFTAPIEKGQPRNLTRSSNAHEREAAWSPDGSRVAYISDRTGEEEIWLAAQDGSKPATQLTSGGQARRYGPRWSPDGSRLAFADKDGRLWVVEVATKKLVEVAKDSQARLGDYSWSPDSRYLAFSLSNRNQLRSLWIWPVDGSATRVTEASFNAVEPVWDPAGDYLFYLADRELGPQFGQYELDYAVNKATGIFALALRKDVAAPFPPESDEVAIEKRPAPGGEADKQAPADAKGVAAAAKKGGEDKKAGEEKSDKAAPKPIRIDFEGLAARVTRVPVPFDNYTNLNANAENLIVARQGAPFFDREPTSPTALVVFHRKDRKLTEIASDVQGYAVSSDGSKILLRTGDGFHLAEAGPGGKDGQKSVSTAELALDRVPREEWATIFDEAWRRYRDYFYVANMHGYDWRKLRDQYRPLLAYVAHRSDLNYVIGEMIAELSVSHAYVEGGDWKLPERPRVAMPGARFALDRAAGRYRIDRILEGQNDEERYRSPLTEVGVDAHVGDYVLAIDGEDLAGTDNPYRLLRHKADKTVTLTLSSRPSLDGARQVTFRPIRSETDLLYYDWVKRCRDRVTAATGGKIGYLHVPDMGGDGLREFIKWYYPQLDKQGLIVDVRDNGGGFISQMLIERLMRKPLEVDFGRLLDYPQVYPSGTFPGPMVGMLNETTASDGDIFSAMFRQAGLGPLIGKRSWGGVVGISGHGPLLDGGDIFVPEAGSADARTGAWIIEGHGVDPDIEVENDPRSLIEGKDPQLERAIAEIQKRVAEHPGQLPPRPADPVKTP